MPTDLTKDQPTMPTLRTSRATLGSTALAAVLLVAACGGTATTGTSSSVAAGPPVSGGSIVYGADREPTCLDPHNHGDMPQTYVARQFLDSPGLEQPDGTVVPWLADSWTTSPDGLPYTFKLKKGVKFPDGTPLDAAAVKANFDQTLDPATQSLDRPRLPAAVLQVLPRGRPRRRSSSTSNGRTRLSSPSCRRRSSESSRRKRWPAGSRRTATRRSAPDLSSSRSGPTARASNWSATRTTTRRRPTPTIRVRPTSTTSAGASCRTAPSGSAPAGRRGQHHLQPPAAAGRRAKSDPNLVLQEFTHTGLRTGSSSTPAAARSTTPRCGRPSSSAPTPRPRSKSAYLGVFNWEPAR